MTQLEKGFSLDNPAWKAAAKILSATVNLPLDRAYQKMENIQFAMDEETEAWQLKLGEKEEAERERERKRQAVMKREQAQKTMGWKPLKYYGYEHGGNPKVGTKYIVGEKGPELVEYDSGRFELVGTKGPEIRQFAEKGTVIPTGKTKKMLKSMFTPRAKGGRVTPPGGGMVGIGGPGADGSAERPFL